MGFTIPLLEEESFRYTGYVTPVNLRGTLILPSQNLDIETIKSVRDSGVAIKALAGEMVFPFDTLEYIFFEVGVEASMVVLASLKEANEDVRRVRRVLHYHERVDVNQAYQGIATNALPASVCPLIHRMMAAK